MPRCSYTCTILNGECDETTSSKAFPPAPVQQLTFQFLWQAHKLIGNASVELDSIPLGGEESIIWLDMLSPNAKDEKDEASRPPPPPLSQVTSF